MTTVLARDMQAGDYYANPHYYYYIISVKKGATPKAYACITWSRAEIASILWSLMPSWNATHEDSLFSSDAKKIDRSEVLTKHPNDTGATAGVASASCSKPRIRENERAALGSTCNKCCGPMKQLWSTFFCPNCE